MSGVPARAVPDVGAATQHQSSPRLPQAQDVPVIPQAPATTGEGSSASSAANPFVRGEDIMHFCRTRNAVNLIFGTISIQTFNIGQAREN
ncbi:hypothetical protein AURDEDRAFT_176473 [Auricularia subglabra TFB-10046 SS5]|uniref:Uncharacterized protein n=1 Tax=Auricularia subglabra (strain TFB-10046 / SS5) TaxID=717982 RepID=J0D6K6_AURST|nr:hypothetical protein AURDEDRAFT_176473 [Auricularia subglabra TFB-10046 SS5]